jgi:hypothetical protein
MAKTKQKKFTWIVRYDGVEFGRRTTHVPYTHALIVQRSEEADRAYADNPSDEHNKYERGFFLQKTQWAKGRIGDLKYPGVSSRSALSWEKLTTEDTETANQQIEGGFDGWLARSRQEQINIIEERKREGYYDLCVNMWMRGEEAARLTKRVRDEDFLRVNNYVFAKVVPTENEDKTTLEQRVAKLPKTALRSLLTEITDKMIARKAWDEIAAFLLSQLGSDDAPIVLRLLSSR